ncbi:MAG: tRNA pseudouridine(55) synthase TruB [Treponema sp.]|jgi:tRNA pseudouridine55 synthase|nr:tRNA pseudouridine(55) synthase TruB [Treponema sp.]
MRGISPGKENEVSGLVLLRKKAGVTSFETLNLIKKAFSTSRVGHTGTLDKFAQGLLLVLAGRAAKLARWFSSCDKNYEGTIRFGIETDTLDPEGISVAEAPVPSRQEIEAVLPQFRGTILQAPPAYSAIHIAGKRASELARAGIIPEMKKRPVAIYAFDLLSYDPPYARIHVHCSSGVYIRSLARDLAISVQSRAHLVSLERTQIAGFPLSASYEAGDSLAAGGPFSALRPIDTGCFEALGLPILLVDESAVQKMIHGKNLDYIVNEKAIRYPASRIPDPFRVEKTGTITAGVFLDTGQSQGTGGGFIGIIEKKAGKWTYGYVYAASGGACQKGPELPDACP